MDKKITFLCFAMAGVLLAMTAAASVASTITVSATAPAVNGADIIQYAGDRDAGGDAGHFWGDRPWHGQTFTTGGDPNGYTLNAVTLKNLNSNNGGSSSWNVRVGTVDGSNVFNPIRDENINGTGVSMVGNTFVTWSFDTPLSLNPNTLYAFDVHPSGSGFVSANAESAAANPYSGGTAVSSGDNLPVSPPNPFTTGSFDRVFHVDLDPGTPQSPPLPTGNSIGVNFGADRADAALAPGDSAGVIPQANWNNAANASGSITGAMSNSGAATGVDVRWTTQESWSLGNAAATPDGTLMKGWVAVQSSTNPSNISISGIPYSMYDLYFYVGHDRNSEDVRITEAGGAFADFVAIEDVDGGDLGATPFFYKLIQESGAAGNYFRIPGLTLSSLSIDFYTEGDDRGPISGLQIVEVQPQGDIPEPMTMALLGVAVGGLGGYIRRRRAA